MDSENHYPAVLGFCKSYIIGVWCQQYPASHSVGKMLSPYLTMGLEVNVDSRASDGLLWRVSG